MSDSQTQLTSSTTASSATSVASVKLEQGGSDEGSHMRGVIREQFAAEVSYKEGELEMIEERILLAKMMLQRLRLGVLAQHYGLAAFYPTALDYREETVGEQDTWELFEKEFVTRQIPNADSADLQVEEEGEEDNSKVMPSENGKGEVDGECPSVEELSLEEKEHDSRVSGDKEIISMETTPPLSPSAILPSNSNLPSNSDVYEEEKSSRFYYKKRIIVGNTSQYLDPAAHQVSDGSTHKWMMYVRGSQTEPDISYLVKAVRFFLHPSYHPNDIVRVRTSPFHLTRLGWGEFPIRIQLEFHNKANKPVDIIHNLVLDRTHTGQQTLGAETLVDLDLVTPPEESKSLRLNGMSNCTPVRNDADENSFSTSLITQSHIDPALESTDAKTLPGFSEDADTDMQMDYDDSTSPTSSRKSNHFLSSSADTFATVAIPSNVGVLTTNLDKCLHNAVRAIPICGKPIPHEDFFIPAPSLAQYRLWNIGRRRATEWERAVAIRKHIERKLKVPSLLSTKQVMEWCRQNGYTPLDPVPASGRGFCKVCGCQLEAGLDDDSDDDEDDDDGSSREALRGCRRGLEVHEHCQTMMFGSSLSLRASMQDPFEELQPDSLEADESGLPLPKLCSLTQPHDLVGKMITLQTRLEEKTREVDEDVDVYSLPPSPSCARSRPLVDMVPRFRVPQTPELKWVQQTASSVGIHIHPAILDRMYAHVVEHMIYISTARFLRGILGQAVQGAGQTLEGQLSQDRVLTPLHIQQAVLKLEHCDFLTNRYLGIRPNLATVESKCGSGSSSSSSSSGESSGEEDS